MIFLTCGFIFKVKRNEESAMENFQIVVFFKQILDSSFW